MPTLICPHCANPIKPDNEIQIESGETAHCHFCEETFHIVLWPAGSFSDEHVAIITELCGIPTSNQGSRR